MKSGSLFCDLFSFFEKACGIIVFMKSSYIGFYRAAPVSCSWGKKNDF